MLFWEGAETVIKRKEGRSALSRAVFYLAESLESHDERYFAYTTNVSDCGVCICTDRPVSEGEVFILESPLWRGARSARAVWSQRLGESLFEVGLELC